MKLSVIIPVYNEINTIHKILLKVCQALPGVTKEVIMVDDGSKDGTREWLIENFKKTNGETIWVALNESQNFQTYLEQNSESNIEFKILFHEKNQGKGAALRTGFDLSTGEALVIQDADLEYDPEDWTKMWRLIEQGHADVVFGSRFYGEPHRVLYVHHLMANKTISNLINITCDTTLTDIEVCYKMFTREVLETLDLSCNDFGFEVEFTMKVALARHWRVYELGISYYGRTYQEGKKINWKDGLLAFWYILKFRLTYRKPKLKDKS